MAKQKQRAVLKYGLYFARPKDKTTEDDFNLKVEFAMIERGGRFKYKDRICGHGLAYHVKAAMKMLWPEQYFHRWTDMILETWLREPPGFLDSKICRTRTGC